MCAHFSRVEMVTDDQLVEAIRAVFDDTHNVAEGAGAAAVAAILQERDGLRGEGGGGGAIGRQCGSGHARRSAGGVAGCRRGKTAGPRFARQFS